MKKFLIQSSRLPLILAGALAATTPALAQSNAELLQEIQALNSRLAYDCFHFGQAGFGDRQGILRPVSAVE